MRAVPAGKMPVVLVRTLDGAYHAVQSICPHQGARLDLGHLTSLTVSDGPGQYGIAEQGGVLRCPWHSFDFDVASGRCVSDHRLRVRTYPVVVEGGEVRVEV
jgi:3-phenylpropionate/trans-cinnamate dioxygenase ferredoxin subunit